MKACTAELGRLAHFHKIANANFDKYRQKSERVAQILKLTRSGDMPKEYIMQDDMAGQMIAHNQSYYTRTLKQALDISDQ